MKLMRQKRRTRPVRITSGPMMGLTPISTNFYHNSRRFPVWGSKGNAVRGNYPNAAAAPATVSGESFVICHWEISVLGRRRTVTTREPGDLPSAVVTREDVGRGVQTLASLRCAEHNGETSFAVTCH